MRLLVVSFIFNLKIITIIKTFFFETKETNIKMKNLRRISQNLMTIASMKYKYEVYKYDKFVTF